MYGVSNYIDDKFVGFAENLPHGSGIDCDWNAYETDKYVYFTNSYHCMNEAGYYEGYQDFSVRIDKAIFNLWRDASEKAQNYKYEPSRLDMVNRANALIGIMSEEFTLQFNNGHYLADKHMLRDYLEDTINYSISEMKNMEAK